MKRARFLIHFASLAVPAQKRAEWSREWLAELHFLGSRDAAPGPLIAFARGSFQDALWQRCGEWDREAWAAKAQSAPFCLAVLGVLIAAISAVSGFLPVTRSIIEPLPYQQPEQVAVVSRTGPSVASDSAVRAESAALWQSQSRLIQGAAAYSWKNGVTKNTYGLNERTLTARVSENFFGLLGVQVRSDCADCVILSYAFWQKALNGRALTPTTTVLLDGQRRRVAGVLEKRFWFLSREISVWTIVPLGSFATERAGVVVRLQPEVTTAEVERDLSSILMQQDGAPMWSNLVRLTRLQPRVRSVFGSFGLALSLAVVIAIVGTRVRLPRAQVRAGLFFAAKSVLLLIAVFLMGVEFTHATTITMLGGSNVLTELLSTWLFLLSCMCVLVWSVRDQQARCRVCLRRLGMPMRVGCPGCLLLDWAGTELVCMEGHGMLHIPEMVSCWEEPERWTSLDESWQDLFQRS
jgi:hypothetical protein